MRVAIFRRIATDAEELRERHESLFLQQTDVLIDGLAEAGAATARVEGRRELGESLLEPERPKNGRSRSQRVCVLVKDHAIGPIGRRGRSRAERNEILVIAPLEILR